MMVMYDGSPLFIVRFTNGRAPSATERRRFDSSLASGDTFQITSNDILGISGNRSLSVYVNSSFATSVSASSGYTLASNVVSGSTRTYTFTKSGESNITLNVLTYS